MIGLMETLGDNCLPFQCSPISPDMTLMGVTLVRLFFFLSYDQITNVGDKAERLS